MSASTPVEDCRIAHVVKQLAIFEEPSKICDSLPQPMGKVLFSTGRALSPSMHVLDFAFVELASIPDAPLPNRNHWGLVGSLPEDHDASGLEFINAPHRLGIGPLEKGHWYYKVGVQQM